MNIHIFSYNEKSILNNGIVRLLNYAILAIIILGGIANATSFSFSLGLCILISIIVPTVSTIATYKAVAATEFFEWDYSEREKKLHFMLKYFFICVFICSLFVFSVIIAYVSISATDMTFGGIALFLVPILFFAFNMCNIPSLYFPVLENEITLGYKIQKEPANWQDCGREIKEEDNIEDIIHRDFK